MIPIPFPLYPFPVYPWGWLWPGQPDNSRRDFWWRYLGAKRRVSQSNGTASTGTDTTGTAEAAAYTPPEAAPATASTRSRRATA